jgi:hypothetical protein
LSPFQNISASPSISLIRDEAFKTVPSEPNITIIFSPNVYVNIFSGNRDWFKEQNEFFLFFQETEDPEGSTSDHPADSSSAAILETGDADAIAEIFDREAAADDQQDDSDHRMED